MDTIGIIGYRDYIYIYTGYMGYLGIMETKWKLLFRV